MKGKGGQIFALYVVLLTIVMCFIVISMYHIQEDTTLSALVSPRVVLETVDSYEVFESRERALVRDSLREASGEFGSFEFVDSFRSVFLSKVALDTSMKDFLLRDATLDGRAVESQALQQFELFLENSLYPASKSTFDGTSFYFGRAQIGKRTPLVPKQFNRINFPVDFVFEFEKEYVIFLEDGEYRILEEGV